MGRLWKERGLVRPTASAASRPMVVIDVFIIYRFGGGYSQIIACPAGNDRVNLEKAAFQKTD